MPGVRDEDLEEDVDDEATVQMADGELAELMRGLETPPAAERAPQMRAPRGDLRPGGPRVRPPRKTASKPAVPGLVKPARAQPNAALRRPRPATPPGPALRSMAVDAPSVLPEHQRVRLGEGAMRHPEPGLGWLWMGIAMIILMMAITAAVALIAVRMM